MKRRIAYILVYLFTLCALSGCSGGAGEAVLSPSPAAETASPASAEADSDASPTEEPPSTVTINGETFGYDGYRIIEPESELPIESMTAGDFTDSFAAVYPVSREAYTLLTGTPMETTVVKITGEAEGPVVYIAAGIHGDERGAWYAGLLLQNITIKAGTLYVLSPVNALGAKNLTRYVIDRQDANRCFPGDPEGNEAEQLCNGLFCDLEEKAPELLLDLHEAIVYYEGRDFLGSTLIYSSLEGMEDLFFSLLFDTQSGAVCSTAFGYNGPGPEGSMNRTATELLGIPSITVETFRGYAIERRVKDQLDIAAYCLRYKGML